MPRSNCYKFGFGRGIGMKVFIVYCHPSKDSFTNVVYKSFEQGYGIKMPSRPFFLFQKEARHVTMIIGVVKNRKRGGSL